MSNKTIHIKSQPNHIAFPSLSPIPIFVNFHCLIGGPTFYVPPIARSTKVYLKRGQCPTKSAFLKTHNPLRVFTQIQFSVVFVEKHLSGTLITL